jgi:hydrogenase nickel incorporation protein HypA/HybF
MHELSIAQNIIDIVHQYVPENELENVDKVCIKIGEVAGIVTDSLCFGYSALISDTPLKNSSLEIENIPFIISCSKCGSESTGNSGITVCSVCGSYDTKIISGLEMQITEVLLNETEEVT